MARPSSFTDEHVARVVELAAVGWTPTAIADAFGGDTHRTTISRLLKRDHVARRVELERARRQLAALEAELAPVQELAPDLSERLRIGDPVPDRDGFRHTADSLARPSDEALPTPPPVPLSAAHSPELSPAYVPPVRLPPIPRYEPRRRRAVHSLSSWGTSLMSPLDQERFHGQGAIITGPAAPDTVAWLLDQRDDAAAHTVRLRSPNGGRVLAVPRGEAPVYLADGWRRC